MLWGCLELRLRYEVIDHTADRGVVIHGRDLAELYRNAAWALADQLCEAGRVRPRERRVIHAESDDAGGTVVRLMNELIYLADVEGLVLPALKVAAASATSVHGTAAGEPLDLRRHRFKGALKAATRHDLALEETPRGLRLRVILDV